MFLIYLHLKEKISFKFSKYLTKKINLLSNYKYFKNKFKNSKNSSQIKVNTDIILINISILVRF